MIVQQAAGGRPALGLHKASSCMIVSFNAHDPPVRERQRAVFSEGKTKFSELLGIWVLREPGLQPYQDCDRPGVFQWPQSGWSRPQASRTGLRRERACWLAGRWTLTLANGGCSHSHSHSHSHSYSYFLHVGVRVSAEFIGNPSAPPASNNGEQYE